MEYDIDQRLTGLWRVVSWMGGPLNGETFFMPAGKPAEVVEFTEDGRYVIRADLQNERLRSRRLRYHSQVASDICEIELTKANPPQRTYGIYSVVKENVMFCMAIDGGERPQTFISSEKHILMMLERFAVAK